MADFTLKQITNICKKVDKHVGALNYMDNITGNNYRPFIILNDSNGLYELKFINKEYMPNNIGAMIINVEDYTKVVR